MPLEHFLLSSDSLLSNFFARSQISHFLTSRLLSLQLGGKNHNSNCIRWDNTLRFRADSQFTIQCHNCPSHSLPSRVNLTTQLSSAYPLYAQYAWLLYSVFDQSCELEYRYCLHSRRVLLSHILHNQWYLPKILSKCFGNYLCWSCFRFRKI